jgi:hypothetical protein
VSSVIGGSSADNRKIRAAHRLLAQQSNALAGESDGDETVVDVIFHIAGPLLAPDYEGIRTGRFSKVKNLMVIQVAVPRELENESEEEILRSLKRYMLDAAELAQVTVAKKKGVPPVGRALEVAKALQDSAPPPS